MAYIPPHKRNSDETEGPSLTPDKLAPLFKKNVNVSSSKSNMKRIYLDRAISKWYAVGLDDGDLFPSSVHLKEITEQKAGEKPLVLVNSDVDNEGSEVEWNLPNSPWVYIRRNMLEDLITSYNNASKVMESSKSEELKPTVVARVGKVLFHRSPSVNLESLRENLTPEILKNMKRRSFYTNVPASYTEKIVNEVVPNIGAEFESEKEIYYVKFSDSTRPDSTLSCKCSVKEHGKLQLYKVELNQVRSMVLDVSIPNKNLDLRLMLNMKRIMATLSDDELQMIKDLIDSAIIDPDVKGWLKWPLGKASSGKYSVDGVWHVRAKTYKNQSLRFKVRNANRFDFQASSGENSWEVNLRLRKVAAHLQEEGATVLSMTKMLEDDLKFIWDNFLSCEHFLT